MYLTANPNAVAESVTVYLTSGAKARKKVFDFDFSDLEIKGRGAGGNIVTRYPVRKIILKSEGTSTMGGLEIWFDETVGRLNRDQRGNYLGKFHGDDRIVVIYKDGTYELTDFELTNRYEPEKVICLDKVSNDTVINAVHYDGQSKAHYLKRFQIETSTLGKRFSFIGESSGSKLLAATTNQSLLLEYDYRPAKSRKSLQKVEDPMQIVEVKGWKANGNRLSPHRVLKAQFVQLESKKITLEKKSVEKPSNLKQTRHEPALEKTEEEPADTGFQVGSTIEFEVSPPKKDQLGLFEQNEE
jgi:topoisomerase-4 subunit A